MYGYIKGSIKEFEVWKAYDFGSKNLKNNVIVK